MAAEDTKDPVVTTGEDSSLTFTMGEEGVTKGGNEGLSVDPTAEGEAGRVKKESEGDGAGGQGDDTAAGAGDEAAGEDAAQDDSGLDLGEFKGDERAKWDKTYKREDGTLSIERLSHEWWANGGKQEGEAGALNEGTYSYLKEAYGLSKSDVKDIEAGLLLKTQSQRKAVLEGAGGEEVVNAAVAWGKQGGYTPEQRERFNTIMASGDQAAIGDALALAVSRHKAATGGKQAAADAATPGKDVTKGGSGAGGGGEGGFDNEEAYQTALRAAMKMPMGSKKEKAQRDLQAKLAASAFFRARTKGGGKK